MDTWFLIAFVRPDSLAAAWPTYLAGMPFNLSHAVSTVLFLLCIFVPWRKKLTHLVQKFGLYARGE